jgi:hypothetical protein
MSNPPPPPQQPLRQVIDYHRARHYAPERTASALNYCGGIVYGLTFSAGAWWLLSYIPSNMYLGLLTPEQRFMIALCVVISLKLGSAAYMSKRMNSSGFFAGAVLSIALIPLIGCGILLALCGGIFR